MDFTGIGFMDKPRITKIMQAAYTGDLANLHGALRSADSGLHKSFATYLAANNVAGRDRALEILQNTSDPKTAIRAAAVCLLAVRTIGQRN